MNSLIWIFLAKVFIFHAKFTTCKFSPVLLEQSGSNIYLLFSVQEKAKEKAKQVPAYRKDDDKTKKKLVALESQTDDISKVTRAAKIIGRFRWCLVEGSDLDFNL